MMIEYSRSNIAFANKNLEDIVKTVRKEQPEEGQGNPVSQIAVIILRSLHRKIIS